MKMAKKRIIGIGAGLVLALALGWVGGSVWALAQSRAVARGSLVEHWASYVRLLTENRVTARVLDPAEVAVSLGSSLDSASMALGGIYDDLSQQQKDAIAKYAKAARAVAVAQQGMGALGDRQHILIFLGCVHAAQARGGSVRACVTREGMYGPVATGSGAGTDARTAATDTR